MDYYCDVCEKQLDLNLIKHLVSNVQKEFGKCKHKEILIKNPNIDDVDRIFYPYKNQNIKKKILSH